jgi:DNA-binding response OmpR family regulator
MRILLADKQARVRYAMRILLEDPNDDFLEAADSYQLLAVTGERKPDLVLLDWALPGLAFTKLVDEIRKLCPSVTIVILGSRPEAKNGALAAGADAFISKAEPPDRLLALVTSARLKGLQK